MIPPIALKVNLDSDVDRATSILVPDGRPGLSRNIWFAEARAGIAGSAVPLLSSRIIMRMRSGDRDDVTVKLRPCVPAELPTRWGEAFCNEDASYRMESEWCGDHRVRSASVISHRAPGSLTPLMDDRTDPVALLDATQRQFVVACTSCGVPIDHLVTLGPIASRTWTDVSVDGAPVAVERWTVGELDLLEVSMHLRPLRDEPADAFELRAAQHLLLLERSLGDRGLPIVTISKTERVLTTFRGRAHDSTVDDSVRDDGVQNDGVRNDTGQPRFDMGRSTT
ncbi:hypothetical protein [Gordonia insulae]|uniref:hypothetical protein n=1 Tax=Gordonia insulae TaxID=2420509 RepID=UPI000F5BD96E|nr:hypothetical protein [Gordonia insulae]